jgi:tRNA pseudouridine55 synthase
MDGFIFVNKQAGPSSFAVMSRIKPLINRARIGHAGTLDPAAGGLLIVAVGKATRLLEYLPAEPKRYTFTLHFGAETDTLDNEGAVVAEGGRTPDQGELAAALPRFIGAILQEPPRFSAIKIHGERAYARARKNESFEMQPREVTISSITCESFGAGQGTAVISVSCSSGTYVRSLARDIARALGTYGFASDIRRTAIGPFTLDKAHEIDAVVASLSACMVPIGEVFHGLPRANISESQVEKLSVGADIALENAPPAGNQPVFGFNERNEIVAVLVKKETGLYHPEKVFLP